MFDNGVEEIFKVPKWSKTDENNFTIMNQNQLDNGVLTATKHQNGSKRSHKDKPSDEWRVK